MAKDNTKKMYNDKIGQCSFDGEPLEKNKDGSFDVPDAFVDVALSHGLTFERQPAKKVEA